MIMNELISLAAAEIYIANCREDVKRKLLDIVFDTVIVGGRVSDVTARVRAAFPSISRDLSLRVSAEMLRIHADASPEEPITDKMYVYVHGASHLIAMAQVP